MKKLITIEQICDISMSYYGISNIDFNSKSQKREIVIARQVAHYFSCEYTKLSNQIIGDKIGGKDHATVSHSCKIIKNLMDTDKSIFAEINEIDEIINKSSDDKINQIKELMEVTIKKFEGLIDDLKTILNEYE